MYKRAESLLYSPTDLAVFFNSEFASWMDRWWVEQGSSHDTSAAQDLAGPHSGLLKCSPDEDDPELRLVARKGDEHELAFLQILKEQGLTVAEFKRTDDAFEQTLAAMKQGVPVIYQGCLQMADWSGYTDFLFRQDGKSLLGSHHYEVSDTKLARSPKPYFLLQLCAYAEMLEHLQGVRPKEIEVILGDRSRKRFPTDSYFYYFRELKRSFTAYQKDFDPTAIPYPGGSASFGRWSSYAEQIFQAADDLSCVARTTRTQIRKLKEAGISTMTALSKCDNNYVTGLSSEGFKRLKDQAKLQLDSRGRERPLYTVIIPSVDEPARGLALLPPASPTDVFFDMEGYPLMEGGLEYLFGAVYIEAGEAKFADWWAHDAVQEKLAFEQFIDWVHARWTSDNAMHIYHYASYEVAAMRRLMGKYATREDKVDDLLRNEVFVDLYTIVRQGLIVGTSSYSLKQVEKLYLPKRNGGVTTAGGSVVAYQKWLDGPDGYSWTASKILREIREYNQVDCESTLQLRDWLLKRQSESRINFFTPPTATEEAATAKVKSERASTQLANELVRQVASGAVADPAKRRLQELLAWLLEFHWREAKPVFWKKFDRHEMTEEELIDDMDCLGGLKRTKAPREAVKKSWAYEYTFDPDQDTKLHEGSKCFFAHDLLIKCELTFMDTEKGLIKIKLGPKAALPPDRLSLIPDEYVDAAPIPQAIYRYVENWSKGKILSQAVDDLLHRRPPRIKGHKAGPLLVGSPSTKQIVDLAVGLDASALCVQGPPGTGKTYTAAEIILELSKLGMKIGITSNSHKAILNAMHAVAKAADAQRAAIVLVKVGKDEDDPLIASGRIKRVESASAADSLCAGVVMGGTAWAFSRDDLVGKFDYLIIDEAGQVSLANVVAVGQAAKNLILVGDQMQLAQPIQGSHPGESGQSALEYLLQGKATVPPEFGIFLDTTWRMHPHICRFISDAVYDGRLKSLPQTGTQEIRCKSKSSEKLERRCGIVFAEVPHQFNSQCSDEEVDTIADLVGQLCGRCVVDRDGKTHDVTLDDILIVAPYNMQVRRLKSRLGTAARIGSVDKFQGQEAPVVIVSMCASSVEDAPRGLEFVLNKNRINVAVSRAKCLAIVVGCRGLMAARCTTIAQMEMANLYCWLAAHAETSTS